MYYRIGPVNIQLSHMYTHDIHNNYVHSEFMLMKTGF